MTPSTEPTNHATPYPTGYDPSGTLGCHARLDSIVRAQEGTNTRLVGELGHLRTDMRDLSAAVRDLTSELAPVTASITSEAAVTQARAKLQAEADARSSAWHELITSPTVRAIVFVVVGAILSGLGLKSCAGQGIDPHEELPQAIFEGPWRPR